MWLTEVMDVVLQRLHHSRNKTFHDETFGLVSGHTVIKKGITLMSHIKNVCLWFLGSTTTYVKMTFYKQKNFPISVYGYKRIRVCKE